MRKLKTEHGMRHNLYKLLLLVKPYKWLVAVALVAIFVSEFTAIAERYIFKLFIDHSTEFSTGALTKSAYMELTLALLIAFAILIAFRVASRYVREHFVNLSDAHVMADLKRKFFNHVIGLSLRFHTTHKTGTLISRLARGGRAVEDMMDTVFYSILPAVFSLLIAAVSLAYVSVMAAIIITITFTVLIGFSLIVEKFRYPARVASNDADDVEKSNIGDILTNIESVKYFAKERAVAARYNHLSETTKAALLKGWNYSRIQQSGQSLILGLGIVATIYFPYMEFTAGEITLGSLVFVYTIFIGLLGPIFSFIQGLRGFSKEMADFESLFEYEHITNDIIDAPHASELRITQGSVEFRNVSFGYNSRQILNNFSLKIARNERIALVGPSGAGKSTVFKLLFRMYDVQQGEILIDGQSIKSVKQESLRSQLSIVPQECVLFDDTIYNNILFSRPTASRDEVLQAIRFAQLDRIIANFPQGENTVVGERGVKLSGGEKQRVSIARAILANKRILVLDEATSSLDSETEADIQKDLQELMKGRTSIIIAHRLSTIMNADRIVVIENGKVTQTGTHKQLIRQKGRYKRLWSLQKGGYIK